MASHSSVTMKSIKCKQKISPTSPIYINLKNKNPRGKKKKKEKNPYAQFVDKK